MARRLGFSVVGLPHYTIWHLYEPSVDDLKHMEEMQQERDKVEQEEAKKKERSEHLFQTPRGQWEVDGAAIHDAVLKEQQQAARDDKAQKGSGEDPGVEVTKQSAGNIQDK